MKLLTFLGASLIAGLGAASHNLEARWDWEPQPYPAQAPGVINPLGKGQDPAPVQWYNASSGQTVYLFPDTDFAHTVWLRVSTNLSDVQYELQANNHTVFQFEEDIITEAPDLSQTGDGRWVMYISAVVLNYVYVIVSTTGDPLGPWEAMGRVAHDGTPIEGYDAHALNLPNGDRYLTWSTSYHAVPSISMIKLQTLNSSMPGTNLSQIVLPDMPYEQQAFPGGNFTWMNHTCCFAPTTYNNPVVEAPCSWVVNNQTVNLGYSANSYDDPTYNLLITTAPIDADLLDPSVWTKSPYNPILNSNWYSRAYGPGSGGFFIGPASSDDNASIGEGDLWFAYGAFNNATGFVDGPNIRTIRAQKMAWDAEGRIRSAIPIAAERSIPGDSWSDYS